MAFPTAGLPNRVMVRSYVVVGTDSDDNTRYEPLVRVPPSRRARYYRDKASEMLHTRETMSVEGMVTFKWAPGDVIEDQDEIVLFDGQFDPITGEAFSIVHATVMMLWSRPSHWEIAVGRTN